MRLHVACARLRPACAVMLATMWAIPTDAGVFARLNRDMWSDVCNISPVFALAERVAVPVTMTTIGAPSSALGPR